MAESGSREYVSQYDPGSREDQLKLVKEIVAMANTAGGTIFLGVEDDGQNTGLPESTVEALDPARLGDLVGSFVAPDTVECEVSFDRAAEPERWVVAIQVARFTHPPVVFTKAGTYQNTLGKQSEVFRQHSVVVRRQTRTEPATREDFRRWRDEAIQQERDEWRARVRMIAELPPGAILIDAGPDALLDEPAGRLRRAVREYQRNSEKLLTGRELLELFLVREALAIGDDEFTLLVQSALRRRPTLWFWLASRHVDRPTVARMLETAIGGSDRDKSDAGRAIVEVAALYLDRKGFDWVIAQLYASRYKHFRDAAEAFSSYSKARSALADQRLQELDDRPIHKWTTDELVGYAEDLARESLASKQKVGLSRTINRIGFEYLTRQGSVRL